MSRLFTIEATCAFGLESLVADELKELGCQNLIKNNGSVRFQGDWKAVCQANIWLRCADRIRIILSSFQARDFETLFQQVKKINWETLLPVDALFPVGAKSIRSELHSTPHIQSIVKKAIVERLKQHYQVDWFEEKGAAYAIEAEILKDNVTIVLDTSGSGLNKRGYRKSAGETPIKETLAAAMIYLSRWRPERPLVDPMCGSGTILIEAAQIGLNIAPGLNREFASEHWKCIDPALWQRVRQEARQARKQDCSFRLQGFDNDSRVIQGARSNGLYADVSEYIHFQNGELADFSTQKKYGYMVSNPPYGERSEDEQTVIAIEKTVGAIMKAHPTWSYYFLTSHEDFEKYVGKKATKNRKLYNGRIKCYYYQYYGPRPPVRRS